MPRTYESKRLDRMVEKVMRDAPDEWLSIEEVAVRGRMCYSQAVWRLRELRDHGLLLKRTDGYRHKARYKLAPPAPGRMPT